MSIKVFNSQNDMCKSQIRAFAIKRKEKSFKNAVQSS